MPLLFAFPVLKTSVACSLIASACMEVTMAKVDLSNIGTWTKNYRNGVGFTSHHDGNSGPVCTTLNVSTPFKQEHAGQLTSLVHLVQIREESGQRTTHHVEKNKPLRDCPPEIRQALKAHAAATLIQKTYRGFRQRGRVNEMGFHEIRGEAGEDQEPLAFMQQNAVLTAATSTEPEQRGVPFTTNWPQSTFNAASPLPAALPADNNYTDNDVNNALWQAPDPYPASSEWGYVDPRSLDLRPPTGAVSHAPSALLAPQPMRPQSTFFDADGLMSTPATPGAHAVGNPTGDADVRNDAAAQHGTRRNIRISNETKQRIIELGTDNPPFSKREISRQLHVSRTAVDNVLRIHASGVNRAHTHTPSGRRLTQETRDRIIDLRATNPGMSGAAIGREVNVQATAVVAALRVHERGPIDRANTHTPRGGHLKQETKDRIIDLNANGMSVRNISHETKLPESSIRIVLNKHASGVNRADTHRPPTGLHINEVTKASIIALYEANKDDPSFTPDDIGRQVGVSVDTIRVIIQQHNDAQRVAGFE